MSDRIGVMSEGRLLQVGNSEEIYENPTSRFVADFIGDINLIVATVTRRGTAKLANGVEIGVSEDHEASGDVTLALRPERLVLHHVGDDVPAGRNQLRARVARRTYYGDVFYYDVEVGLDEPLEVKEENRPDIQRYDVGEEVLVTWRPEAANLVTD